MITPSFQWLRKKSWSPPWPLSYSHIPYATYQQIVLTLPSDDIQNLNTFHQLLCYQRGSRHNHPPPGVLPTAFSLAALTQLWVLSMTQHRVILLNHKEIFTWLTTLQKSLISLRVKQSPYHGPLGLMWHGLRIPLTSLPFPPLSPTLASQLSLGQVHKALLLDLCIGCSLFPTWNTLPQISNCNPCRSLTSCPILREAFHYYTV